MHKEIYSNTTNLKNDCEEIINILSELGGTCESFINDCEHKEPISESLDKLAKIPTCSHIEIIAKLDLLSICT